MKTTLKSIKTITTPIIDIIKSIKAADFVTFIINDKDYDFNSVISLGNGRYTLTKLNDKYLENKSHNHHTLSEILDFLTRHKPVLYVSNMKEDWEKGIIDLIDQNDDLKTVQINTAADNKIYTLPEQKTEKFDMVFTNSAILFQTKDFCHIYSDVSTFIRDLTGTPKENNEPENRINFDEYLNSMYGYEWFDQNNIEDIDGHELEYENVKEFQELYFKNLVKSFKDSSGTKFFYKKKWCVDHEIKLLGKITSLDNGCFQAMFRNLPVGEPRKCLEDAVKDIERDIERCENCVNSRGTKLENIKAVNSMSEIADTIRDMKVNESITLINNDKDYSIIKYKCGCYQAKYPNKGLYNLDSIVDFLVKYKPILYIKE